jgi:hypothetical protein
MRFRSKTHKFLRCIFAMSLILGALVIPSQNASAEITLPPKGVSQELWKAYQEIVIKSVDGADRNLRWNTNPSFYIYGNPTAADNNTFQGTLLELRKYCLNIQPNFTTTEPFEGVLLNYLSRANFKTVIPATPESVTTSYASYLYYLNRGLTKYTATISSEATQSQRDVDTQIRMYQGLGLLGYTKNTNARMFSWMFPFTGVINASELDKQILRLYCSSYSRSWDTAQQTFDAIASAWVKKISIPNLKLNVKVGEYKNQLNFELNFDASQALDNQLSGIQYTIYDSAGSIAMSGKVDVSENLFKSYEVVLSGIKDSSRYKIEAFPFNSNGNGSISRGEGRAGTQPAPSDSMGTPTSGASAELEDARNAGFDSTNAAKEAITAFQSAKSDCVRISEDFELEEQELFDFTNLTAACEVLNDRAVILRTKIFALDPAKATSVEQANKIISEANSLAEDADSIVAEIQDITDELVGTEKDFTKLQTLINPLNDLDIEVIQPWESLQERMELLPLNLVSSLRKNQNYKSAMDYFARVEVVVLARDTQVEALSSIEQPSQIGPLINKLSGIKFSATQLSQFKKSMASLNKLIPSNVCQKGSVVALTNKSGKCAKGFTRIPTS